MDCFLLTDVDYETFRNDLNLKVGNQRVPLMASVEATMGCNLRCKHCYVPIAQRVGLTDKELSVAEFERIFDEFVEEGVLWLLLTGGEPFERPDFLQIYDAAKRRGFILSLFTNGTHLTEEIVDHLAEWRPFEIEITLYGATEETYERITGVPGSYAQCMRGINLVLDRNLHLKLKTVLMTLNQHELEQMKQFSANLGVDFRYDAVINPGVDGSLRPLQYQIPVRRILELESQDPKLANAWRSDLKSKYSAPFDRSKKYICAAGLGGFHMDAYGRVSLCMTARRPFFDLRKGNFKECWGEFLPKAREGELSPDDECRKCQLRSICGQCPGMSMNQFGCEGTIVPLLCDLAHLRYNWYDIQQNEIPFFTGKRDNNYE